MKQMTETQFLCWLRVECGALDDAGDYVMCRQEHCLKTLDQCTRCPMWTDCEQQFIAGDLCEITHEGKIHERAEFWEIEIIPG